MQVQEQKQELPQLRDLIYNHLLVSPILMQRVVTGIRQLSPPHYIVWTVKLNQKDTPELPEDLVINNRHIFKVGEVEFRIALYCDRAIFTCIDIPIGTFLYADPAFPDDLLTVVDETKRNLLATG